MAYQLIKKLPKECKDCQHIVPVEAQNYTLIPGIYMNECPTCKEKTVFTVLHNQSFQIGDFYHLLTEKDISPEKEEPYA